MSYHYAKQTEVTELNKLCRNILTDVQKEIKNYFTFDIRLIGSGEKRLVTQNSEESFDLDYNIILQKDKMDLVDNPKKIKDTFINAFNRVMPKYIKSYERSHVDNSTSVITLKLIKDDKLNFSFDVAILIEGNDGFYYRLIYDKPSNRYIWNQVKKSKNYMNYYSQLKQQGLFPQFKDRYLELKNIHLERNDDMASFSIFLETLNEFK